MEVTLQFCLIVIRNGLAINSKEQKKNNKEGTYAVHHQKKNKESKDFFFLRL